MRSEEIKEVLAGMSLCDAAVQEIMPLSGNESFQEVKQKYVAAVDEYPENWPELTLGVMSHLLAHFNSTPADKQNLSDFLKTCATSFDTISD